MGLREATTWLDPIDDPNYVWHVRSGPLAGLRMRIGSAENYHVVGHRYEPAVCDAIACFVRPGFVCADIGAHIGFMSLLLARTAGPTGRVIAFEPNAANAALLQQNVVLNDFTDVVVVEHAAVSDGSHTSVAFCCGPTSFQGTTIATPASNTNSAQTVRAVSVDAYLGAQGHLDFAKIDVEGAETEVIRGMTGVLRRARPTLLIEIHGERGTPALGILESAGYGIFELSGEKRVAPPPSEEIIHVIAKPA
jgi:FkbM family methyltransferase